MINYKVIINLKYLGLVLLFVSFSCSSENEDPMMVDTIYNATFNISGDGYNESLSYNSTDNLIFCRLTGDDMWIRLAQDKASNGDNSPHIDIDICNYSGAGTYTPVDPTNRPCPDGMVWDIFWHDADRVYSNLESSSPCQLILTLNNDVLSGTFSCNDVIRSGSSESISITQGTFTCAVN